MATTEADRPYDVSEEEAYERSSEEPKLVPSVRSSGARTEAAAALVFWSVLTLGEGTIRFIASDPARDLTPGGPGLSPLALFLGGIFEALFGLAGLLVGVAALVFSLHSVAATTTFLVFQTLLSAYVFVVYVFLQPALRGRDLVSPLLPGMSIGSSRAVIAMGILTSVSFCVALQGGQFLMGLRLLAYQKQVAGVPAGFASTAVKNNRLRTLGWSLNMLLGGVSTVVAGAVVARQVTGGSTFPLFYAAPPHVGVYPVLSVVTGLLMVTTGVVGAACAAAHGLYGVFVGLCVPNYLLMFANFAFVQVGGIGGGRAIEAGPLHSGLVAVTALIAPYFAAQWHKERTAAA